MELGFNLNGELLSTDIKARRCWQQDTCYSVRCSGTLDKPVSGNNMRHKLEKKAHLWGTLAIVQVKLV